MSQFQSRLKELKERSGKTQARIASDLGVTPQAFSYYINGREPDFDLLIRIASYFNVSTDYLLGKSDVRCLENSVNNEKLGLSEASIESLSEFNACAKGAKPCFMPHVYQERLDVINLLLENEKRSNLLENIASYIWHDYEKISGEEEDLFIATDTKTAEHMKMLRVKEKHSGNTYVFDPNTLIQAELFNIESILMSYRKNFQQNSEEK